MAKFDWKSLLCELLDCGYLDLQILEDSDEDYVLEAIEHLKYEELPVSLNSITGEMFYKAKNELMEAWEARMEVLEDNEDDLTDDERDELADMRKLNPDEDITWFCNCLDTHIHIRSDVYDIYRNWFDGLVDDLEAKTGFEFEY